MATAAKKTSTKKSSTKAAKSSTEVSFEFDRATKNTFRFNEIVEGDGPAVVGTLYVQKSAFGDKEPTNLRVTIESV